MFLILDVEVHDEEAARGYLLNKKEAIYGVIELVDVKFYEIVDVLLDLVYIPQPERYREVTELFF